MAKFISYYFNNVEYELFHIIAKGTFQIVVLN